MNLDRFYGISFISDTRSQHDGSCIPGKRVEPLVFMDILQLDPLELAGPILTRDQALRKYSIPEASHMLRPIGIFHAQAQGQEIGLVTQSYIPRCLKTLRQTSISRNRNWSRIACITTLVHGLWGWTRQNSIPSYRLRPMFYSG